MAQSCTFTCDTAIFGHVVVDNDEPEQPFAVDETLFLENLALLYLKLQGKLLLPASTIQTVIEDFQNAHEISLLHSLKILSEKLKDLGIQEPTISSIIDEINSGDLLKMYNRNVLSTDQKRKSVFKNTFNYVEPLLLGSDENDKESFAQYISIHETLATLFKSEPFREQHAATQACLVTKNIIRDVSDGHGFQSNQLLKTEPSSVGLILYQDAFEIYRLAKLFWKMNEEIIKEVVVSLLPGLSDETLTSLLDGLKELAIFGHVVVDNDEPEQPFAVDETLFLENLALLYLKLQGKLLLPASTIQTVIEDFQNAHEISLLHSLKILSENLKDLGIQEPTISSIIDEINSGDLLKMYNRNVLSTDQKRKSVFKNTFNYVEPLLLGSDENDKESFAQYISIHETLATLFKSEPFREQHAATQACLVTKNIIRDVSDGHGFQSNQLLKTEPSSVGLILYQDAFEIYRLPKLFWKMNEEIIKEVVVSLLPGLSDETLTSLLDGLKELGVENREDLAFVQEKDIEKYSVMPVGIRRAVANQTRPSPGDRKDMVKAVVDHMLEYESNPTRVTCHNIVRGIIYRLAKLFWKMNEEIIKEVVVSLLPGLSDETLTSLLDGLKELGVENREDLAFDRMPVGIRRAVANQTRPSPGDRKDMVKAVVDHMLEYESNPTRVTCHNIVRGIVRDHSKSFADVGKNGDVIGDGCYSLQQIKTTVEYKNRNNTLARRRRERRPHTEVPE
ncbi:hypothetical protein EXN66_Car001769 [Channa argus]|uniref:Uncharacterized protein n=1 Tax=Channa argus TaxID=215402 RepID=A0A6G1R1E5_CHAAH|nr:hypothetical protein EXN66_Car001769 [Channa argus]